MTDGKKETAEKKARKEEKRLEAKRSTRARIQKLEAEVERLRAIIAKQLY